jgi:hypothetical protein
MMNELADDWRARELGNLVRKLRWIGDDDGARQVELKLLISQGDHCVLASPIDTD